MLFYFFFNLTKGIIIILIQFRMKLDNGKREKEKGIAGENDTWWHHVHTMVAS